MFFLELGDLVHQLVHLEQLVSISHTCAAVDTEVFIMFAQIMPLMEQQNPKHTTSWMPRLCESYPANPILSTQSRDLAADGAEVTKYFLTLQTTTTNTIIILLIVMLIMMMVTIQGSCWWLWWPSMCSTGATPS